jgi:PAS domain S-box-containing protein
MLLLLLFAAWYGQQDVKIIYDVDQVGSLRYRSLYIYGAVNLKEKVAETSPTSDRFPEWHSVLQTMESIREDVRHRYPTAVARTDNSWNAFSHSLKTRGTVDWVTTNTFREDANTLMDRIKQIVRQRMDRISLLYAFGIAGMAIALPWGVILFAELRETQRQLQTENAERAASSHRFRALFAGLPAACFAFDSDGKILLWNTAAETTFERPVARVVGRRLSEIFGPSEDSCGLEEIINGAISGKEQSNFEWNYTPPGSSTKHLLTNVFPLREGSDVVTGGISATVDITALKEAEERLHSVLVGVRCIVWDAIVVSAPEPPYFRWTLQLWNLAAAKHIVPLDTTDENYIAAWMASREEDQGQLDQTSATAFQKGLPGYTQEFRCRDRFGAVHWLREDVHIQPLEQGHWRAIGVCTDISDRKEAEERLYKTTRELERSNAALQDFASIASHDLKEPLRKIHTFGGMLTRKNDPLSPEAKGYLDRMMASVTRMQSLIDGLMSYSRVTTKGNAFALTDLNEVVKGVLNDLEVRLQETGAHVTMATLPSLPADAVQMRQLFQNLIENALKFHRPNAPLCIHIGYTHEESNHVITLRDNGVGFSPRDSERIFEMFERLDGAGREGTGIGLSICRKIAERHGGTLTASGVPNAGATFTLTL